MPRFTVKHITRYIYSVPVRDNANQIMLYPVKDIHQAVLKHSIKITNDPQVMVYKDYYGNEVGVFEQASPHQELTITSDLIVITTAPKILAETLTAVEQWPLLTTYKNKTNFIDYMFPEPFQADKEVKIVANQEKQKNATPLETALKLNTYVYEEFQYVKGITSVETTVDEIWKIRAGVCQDFAHILLSMLRSIDIPARYVSGYICPNKDGMRGEGATHAWVEAFIPGLNWVGLDPTNNCVVTDKHIRLANGRSFLDCSPVKGTFKGASTHTLEVGVSVSYDNDHKEGLILNAVLQPKPLLKSTDSSNSYRKYMEMMQRKQQEQQQQ